VFSAGAGAGKRIAGWVIGILVFAFIGNFAVKRIMSLLGDGTGQEETASRNDATDAGGKDSGNLPRASQSNPDVATVNELATPWSSKKFLYRNLAASRYVPALIVRLPGPAASGKSYWAFSLEAPFSNCKLEYLSEPQKLSDYGVYANHPMVVNPCTRSVFDPLQMKELPGHILVRGAILQGYDTRPPYGIDVKVSGTRVLAVAME
jgi:hypothetical protein